MLYQIEIFNAYGTSSKKCDIIQNASKIDVSSLPDGLYFVKIKDFSNNSIEIKKFIKLFL